MLGLGEYMMMQGVGMSYLASAVLWFLPVAYLLLRWRSYRENRPSDPQLGLKTVLYYFRSVGYQVMLAGLACAIFGLLVAESRDEMLRVGVALALSGGIIYGSQAWLLLRHTNTAEHPAAAKLFCGFNLALVALVTCIALVALLALIFARHTPLGSIRLCLAVLVVYAPAWAVQLTYLLRYSRA